MSDKHLYDAKGNYVGKISDKAPSIDRSEPVTVLPLFGVCLVWTLISAISYPYGAIGFLIPCLMAVSYFSNRVKGEGFKLKDWIALLISAWSFGNILVAAILIFN